MPSRLQLFQFYCFAISLVLPRVFVSRCSIQSAALTSVPIAQQRGHTPLFSPALLRGQLAMFISMQSVSSFISSFTA